MVIYKYLLLQFKNEHIFILIMSVKSYISEKTRSNKIYY